MHILESFSLNSAAKIDKPFIYEKYVPLPFEGDYIVLQPNGKYQCRQYDLWEEVMDILDPVLKKNNIKVVQVGTGKESKISRTMDMRGKTDYNQLTYLIRNSLLHLGVDTCGIHIASALDKKIVGLYCNMYPSHSGPYWSSRKNVSLLEPLRKEGQKPSYWAEEWPKSINLIYPEKVAQQVLYKLGLAHDYPYQTLHIGLEYPLKKIELVPLHYVVNWEQMGVDSIIVRMDKYFNEEVLIRQLSLCKCSIVTDRPIRIDALKKFRGSLTEFVFIIKDTEHLEYFSELKKANIKFVLMTYLDDDEFNKLKLDLLDYGQVLQKKKGSKEDIKEKLKDKNLSKIYFKTNNFSVIKNEVFLSTVTGNDSTTQHPKISGLNFTQHQKTLRPIIPPVNKVSAVDPQQVIDLPEFWENLDSMIILEKVEKAHVNRERPPLVAKQIK